MQVYTVLLWSYVADPATFLDSKSVLETLFSFENSLGFFVCLFVCFLVPDKTNIF